MEKRLKKYLKAGEFNNVRELVSKIMSTIRGKNNRSTELTLRMELVRSGIKGWTLNVRELPGTPDFYFPKKRISIFVDGCYWHGCPKCGHIPKTRSDFWRAKINRNKQRDRIKRTRLKKMGIKPLGIWEHEKKLASMLKR